MKGVCQFRLTSRAFKAGVYAIAAAVLAGVKGRTGRLFGAAAALALVASGIAPGEAWASQTVSLVWSPTTTAGTYDFGTLDAGAGATSSVTFTLTSSGVRASGDIKSVSLSGSPAFTITADTCTGISLGPGETCTVTVAYRPATAGESDTATLTANATQAVASVSLSGQAGVPKLGWSTPEYDFGTVTAGQTPIPAETFTLSNSGTATSDTITTSLSGSGAFTITDDTCDGTSLAPSATCSVTVAYAPATAGEVDGATLTANATQAVASVSLSGQAGVSKLGWSTSEYDFGTVTAGQTPIPAETFTLSNSGTATSDIITTSLSGSSAFTITADTCNGMSLGPDMMSNSSCTVTIEYKPTGSETDSTILSAGGVSVDITGSGQTANALPPVANVVVDPGTDAQETVSLSSNGGVCNPQDPSGGGCPLQNVQDGSTTVVFDAAGSVDPNSTNNDDLEYQWQILFPPTLQSGAYTSDGIAGPYGCRAVLAVTTPPPNCGYDSPVLYIYPNSLPALLGTDAGSDIYWRAQLLITDPNTGLYTMLYFRFKYENTQLTLSQSTNCQEQGYIDGSSCPASATDGLPLRSPDYQPGNFSASVSTTGIHSGADITWSSASPGDDGGTVTYTINCVDETATTFATCGSPTTSTSETVTGLIPGDRYIFIVIATDIAVDVDVTTSKTYTFPVQNTAASNTVTITS